jgi:hypothetical protein
VRIVALHDPSHRVLDLSRKVPRDDVGPVVGRLPVEERVENVAVIGVAGDGDEEVGLAEASDHRHDVEEEARHLATRAALAAWHHHAAADLLWVGAAAQTGRERVELLHA